MRASPVEPGNDGFPVERNGFILESQRIVYSAQFEQHLWVIMWLF
ncbi:hypothetical protein QFZ50_001148 [Arthrobacter agilis]|nr:hypothetical protein [Arthrobacter agilis]MDQ0734685.1 hypothetical protein [Arthrobacter agilis]